MSDSFNDELLSAYFDDELSPEERADVEHQLESSEASTQDLDDVRRALEILQRSCCEGNGGHGAIVRAGSGAVRSGDG